MIGQLLDWIGAQSPWHVFAVTAIAAELVFGRRI